jgi:hypothetical protein
MRHERRAGGNPRAVVAHHLRRLELYVGHRPHFQASWMRFSANAVHRINY